MSNSINKYCHILKKFDQGGLQQIVFDIAISSPKQHIIICGSRGKLADLAEKKNVEIIELFTTNKLLLVVKLLNKLSKHKYKKIFLHYSFEGLIACQILRIPFYEIWHNEYLLLKNLKKKIYSLLLKKAKIYSFSNKVIKTNCKLFNLSPSATTKITYGINDRKFTRKKANNNNNIIIGAACRNDTAKGINEFLKIASFFNDIEFKLKTNNINSLPNLPNLELQEFSLDICTFYESIDVFIITSKRESGPLTLLENMAYGNIVISSDVGIVEEVIENGVNGFIYHNNNFQEVFEIINMINNMSIQEKEKVAENAKLTIKNNYCIKNMIRSMNL